MYEVINIVDVLVLPLYRNNGIATKLFNYLIDNYSSKCEKFMLEVRASNAVAIRLYENFGFKCIHVRKKYYGDEDALIMERCNMKDVYIMAFESSCDETSVSIVKNGKVDVATTINTQIDVHRNYGGVVPEVASRLHLENITMVIDETLNKANMKLEDIDAFACTYGPGLLGSLLVGLESAKTLSMIYKKPFIKVNHMMGHILANNIDNDLEYPLISLVISGGHTDLIYMEDEYSFKYLGQTLDDAVGECYDKVARILDIPYPGGPNVEKLAREGKPTYLMPKVMNDDTCNFSFSGLKSHVNNVAHNEKQRGHEINKEDFAKSFQDAVIEQLVSKTKKALMQNDVKMLTISGGVASNMAIRESVKQIASELGVRVVVPERKYCTDNATMIGAAAYVMYKRGIFAGLDTNAKSNEKLNIE